MKNKIDKFDEELVAGETLVVKAKFDVPMYAKVISILLLVSTLILLIVTIVLKEKSKSYQTYTPSYPGYPGYPTYRPTYTTQSRSNNRFLYVLLSSNSLMLFAKSGHYMDIKKRFFIVTENRVKVRIMGVKYSFGLDRIKNVERRGSHTLVLHFNQDYRGMRETQNNKTVGKRNKEKLSLKIDCISNAEEVYQKLWAAIEAKAMSSTKQLGEE